MYLERIRKKLITEAFFNPYCDKFSFDKARAELEKIVTLYTNEVESGKIIQEKEIDLIVGTIELLPYFNQCFQDYYNITSEKLNELKYPIEKIINFQFALHNRTICGLFHTTVEDLVKDKVLTLEQSYGHTIQALDPNVRVNSRSAAETSVDSLCIALNYYRYFLGIKTENANPDFLNVLNFCHNTDVRSQVYYVLKSEYNNFTWANGFISFDNNSLKFDWFNYDEVVNNTIGFFRLNRNSTGFYFLTMEKINRDVFKKKLYINAHIKRTRGTKIKKTWVESNYTKCEIENGIDEEELSIYLRSYSDLASYYNFLEDSNIPNSPDLKVIDLLELYLPLRSLFSKLTYNSTREDKVFNFADAEVFPTRVKREDLKNYLLARSIYNETQIEYFISLIVQTDVQKRINLWDKFFIQIETDLYFSLLPITSSITLYCMDVWMEACGMDLDFRGNSFEKYLRSSLVSELEEKKYWHQVPSSQKLILSNGKYEEIDLLINLKNKVILAELKCIKFPLNHIDNYNSRKRIKDGSHQALRKKNFIQQNRKELTPIIGEISGKEIIPLVITNCPIFTCSNYNGVQVVDYFLIEAYFNTGAIGVDKIEFSGSSVSSIDRVEEKKFYSNEDEFGDNFSDHMANPPTILKLRKEVEVKDYPLGLPEAIDYKVIVSGVDFKYV